LKRLRRAAKFHSDPPRVPLEAGNPVQVAAASLLDLQALEKRLEVALAEALRAAAAAELS
jgi:hypothetical protein